jgi:hypothetical protein
MVSLWSFVVVQLFAGSGISQGVYFVGHLVANSAAIRSAVKKTTASLYDLALYSKPYLQQTLGIGLRIVGKCCAYVLEQPYRLVDYVLLRRTCGSLASRSQASHTLIMPVNDQPTKPEVGVQEGLNEADAEYEVDEIVNSRLRGKKKELQYLVKWVGWEEKTWCDWKQVLPGSDQLVRGFHDRNPGRPGPPQESALKEESQKALYGSAKRTST